MNSEKNIPSPCISVCTMDEDTGLCLGCWRTLEEIARWESHDDKARLKILELIAKRQKRGDNSPTYC